MGTGDTTVRVFRRDFHLELDWGRPCGSQRGFGASEAFGKDHGRIMILFRIVRHVMM